MPLFDEDDEYYVNFLTSKGYRVYKLPPIQKSRIKSVPGLVDLFYARLYAKYPETKFGYAENKNREIKFAKHLYESRVSTGISKERAIDESARLINSLFDNMEKLNLSGVSSLSIFGQDHMYWVTEALLKIINTEDDEAANKEFDLIEQNIFNSRSDDVSVNEARKFLDQSLGREDTNGQK